MDLQTVELDHKETEILNIAESMSAELSSQSALTITSVSLPHLAKLDGKGE